jgi:hypothetical protein
MSYYNLNISINLVTSMSDYVEGDPGVIVIFEEPRDIYGN